MNLKEIRDKARTLTKGSCRVCPVCDGRVCSGEVPGMGGTLTGVSFRNNISALANIELNTKLVHRVYFPKLETEILGFKLKLPLMVGPVGGIAFNLAGAISEEEYQEAVALGAADGGIVAGTPDAVPIEVMRTGLSQATKLGGGGILPFIKPWEPDKIAEKLDMCLKAGCKVVACDLDSIGLITLRLMGQPAYPKDLSELSAIIKTAHDMGLNIIIKGVMTPEDAQRCLQAGADGLVVSNHGGRVLDCVPGTAEVLPAIAKAVKGKVALFVDGGVRTGVDIFKMLTLGADAVMIGRPYSIVAIGGGREGVTLYTETLRAQLEQAMIMTGCPDVKEAYAMREEIIYSPPK
ncbi:MAG: alpha-hydroxy-acid oxidizing protein [Deltaproteobacteria bacterium]|jgi:pentose-5-phosphate-3-epimerase|nr:alpha-hydroxy-acid oxidizing protein [Deltaproteobacteria bacterium]